jgi:delta 1-pyrroline-5-carboxylate dehydrogenase
MVSIQTRQFPLAKCSLGLTSACSTHGPLIHDRAVKKVAAHVDSAIAGGASVLVGGKRPDIPGYFFAPTVLADVPPSTLLSDEETFGPLAALIKFETEEEVIKLANNSEVGLAGYFYSRDVGRVWRVAEALEVGMVGTNTGLITAATIPFGGVKQSGYGMFASSSTYFDRLTTSDARIHRSGGGPWHRGISHHQADCFWWFVKEREYQALTTRDRDEIIRERQESRAFVHACVVPQFEAKPVRLDL